MEITIDYKINLDKKWRSKKAQLLKPQDSILCIQLYSKSRHSISFTHNSYGGKQQNLMLFKIEIDDPSYSRLQLFLIWMKTQKSECQKSPGLNASINLVVKFNIYIRCRKSTKICPNINYNETWTSIHIFKTNDIKNSRTKNWRNIQKGQRTQTWRLDS